MRSGTIFQRRPLAPLTDETASGSWPTPDASVANDGEGPQTFYERRERLKEKGYNGNGAGVPLAVAAQVGPEWRSWPTPTTQDAHNDGGPSQFARRSLPLNAAVKTWPTPRPGSAGRGGGSEFGTYRRTPSQRAGKHGLYLQAEVNEAEIAAGRLDPKARGQLNPTWVEWLMGFPLGWTDCGPSATRSSRRSRSGSANAS